jgi:hypothetical protein
MDLDSRLRLNVRMFLVVSGHTQGELADHIGLKRNTLNGKLSGLSTLLPYLESTAEFFGVDPRLLLADPDRVWHAEAVTPQYSPALVDVS